MAGRGGLVACLIWLLGTGIGAQERPATPGGFAAIEVPGPPQDPAAAKAYAVLDKHCARCHQSGKLKVPLPARPIANVLDVSALAANAAFVRPGAPDVSRLYTVMLGRDTPHDQLADGGEEPTADELRAVRDWIQGTPDRRQEDCRGIVRLDTAATSAAMLRSIEAKPEAGRANLRYISLAHLHNACTSPVTMAGYRQAVSKLINGATWAPVPVRLDAIDPMGAILELDLASIGWVGAHWERLVAAYPYAGSGNDAVSAEVVKATGSAQPMLRGDWLAHAMTQPALYAEMLGLPSRFGELQRLLNVDVDAGLRAGTVVRAGVRDSRIVRGPRIVERHALAGGAALWLSHDFAGATGRQNIVEHPLGPHQSTPTRQPFRRDAGRALFHLPNGFIAFAQQDARGDRVDLAPAQVERTPLPASVLGCLGCHRSGPVGVKDEVRPLIEADRAVPRDLRDAVLALYATEGELARHLRTDATRYVAAQVATGVDPATSIAGLEPIAALAAEYEVPATAARVAEEAGLAVGELLQRAEALGGEPRLLGLKLRQGQLDRSEINRLLAALAGRTAKAPAPGLHQGLEARRGPDLVIWSERERYKPGELVVFGAHVSADCHLTIVNIDAAGKATVLYPNEFEQNNLVTAGRDLRLPAEGAPYQFRAKDKGRETLVGVCSPTLRLPDGILPDYERQRFTMLGNWSNFLAQSYTEEAGERRQAEGKQTEAKKTAKRKSRSRTEAKSDGKADPKRRDVQVRAAITYDVE